MKITTPLRHSIVFFALFVLSGCAKLAHLQELLTLKAYSDEKEQQGVFVEAQNQNFDRLLTAAKRGDLDQYPDQKSIWDNFGEPVYETKVDYEENSYQVWIYRYATKLSGSAKVYLYFDNEGYLNLYDYTPGGMLTSTVGTRS